MRLFANRVNAHAQRGRKTKMLVMTPKPLADKHYAESGNKKVKIFTFDRKKFEVNCYVNLLTGMPESSFRVRRVKEIERDDCNTKMF